MTKAKILEGRTHIEIEQKVNEFIKNKKIINISYSVVGCGYGYIYGCCILYEN